MLFDVVAYCTFTRTGQQIQQLQAEDLRGERQGMQR
jgi:hypothetical protein